jgi:hypothetical protein
MGFAVQPLADDHRDDRPPRTTSSGCRFASESRSLDIAGAAARLGIDPAVLQGWVRRYGFPGPPPGEGRDRVDPRQVLALQRALVEAPSLSVAIGRARAWRGVR